jgi:death-on-curing protein
LPSKFLTKRLVLAIHRDLIKQFGGELGVRDEGLLESAVEQPQASFAGELLHRSIHEQAAAYLFHLARNHPFVDGNKRMAFAAADVFLRINHLRLELSDDEAYELVMEAATGSIDKEEIAARLKRSTRRSG